MMFEKEDSLIIKVSADRVNELIAEGEGNEFNFTKKRFKEWVMIPIDYEDKYKHSKFLAKNLSRSSSVNCSVARTNLPIGSLPPSA